MPRIPIRISNPVPVKIEHLVIPGGLGVRWDSHVYAGYTVPPYYDSMIGKLLVHRPTREEAIATMLRCLDELQVAGIETTAPSIKKCSHTLNLLPGQLTPSLSNAHFKNSADQLLDSCIADG